MNTLEIIENQRQLIYQLKNELIYSKDKIKDAERINTLVDTVNEFDSFLNHNFKISVIDKLVCYIIKDWIINLTVEGGYNEEIPLKMMVDKMDSILDWDSELHIHSLATEINSYLIAFNARRLKFDDNKGLSELSQENTESAIETVVDEINNVPSVDHYEKLIRDLLYQFKKNISWKK